MKYPEQYLHVTHNPSGETWVVPIGDNTKLDLERLTRKWAKERGLTDEMDGIKYRVSFADHSFGGLEYHAAIYIDGRAPGSVCWEACDFCIDERV